MTLRRTVAELSALRATPRRLLAVFAHPDDESYGCAGVFARLAQDADAAAVLLCLTRGEASSMGRERGLSPGEVAALREDRLARVAALCDLAGLVVGHLPDGRLAKLPLEAVTASIAAVLAAFTPHVVITHDARGVNGHADHIATHWAVRRSLEGQPDVRLALTAYTRETAEAARPRLLFATSPADIDASISLAPAEIEVKEACLRVHEAVVTLSAQGPADLPRRPPVEHYDLFGEAHDPPLADLFARRGRRDECDWAAG